MERNLRKERIGVVVSNKMDKSITVAIKRKEKHQETDTQALESVAKSLPSLIRAEKLQKKLRLNGLKTEIYREEPFTTAKDSLEFHVYLMIDEKCGKNRYVRIEEVK